MPKEYRGKRAKCAIEEIASSMLCAYRSSKQFYSEKQKVESMGSRIPENIASENETESHGLARNRKATGQLHEMEGSFVKPERDRN